MAGSKRTSADVQAEIEKLQAEADVLRTAELEGVIADVRSKVAQYGLTERDVFGKKSAKKTARNSTVKAPLPPKYQDPKTGATWSGKGRAPAWIASARNRDRFLIPAAA